MSALDPLDFGRRLVQVGEAFGALAHHQLPPLQQVTVTGRQVFARLESGAPERALARWAQVFDVLITVEAGLVGEASVLLPSTVGTTRVGMSMSTARAAELGERLGRSITAGMRFEVSAAELLAALDAEQAEGGVPGG